MLRDAKQLGCYLLGGAFFGAGLGYLGRHELDSEFLILIGFWLFFLSPLVLLVCVRRSFALTVLCVGAALLVGLICAAIVVAPAETADKRMAIAYFDSIKSRLEDFRSAHGRYPDTLAELDIPAAPWGFEYHCGREEYVIDYGSLEYHSSGGTWFDDD